MIRKMEAENIRELIRLIPKILWVLVAVMAIVIFRSSIESELFPRVQSIKGFGIEVALFAEEGLRSAAKERDVPIDESAISLVMDRANRAAEVLKNKSILWLDDNPSWNNHEVKLFRTLGLLVDRVTTEKDALIKLQSGKYDIFLSDIKRNEKGDAGVVFLKDIHNKGIKVPTVFYITSFKPELGIPPFAFGVTSRPDELLHFVIDLSERLGA